MAEGMNSCVFSGNLTKDAMSKEVNGSTVARYTVAVNGRKDEVTYVQCSHWEPKGVLPYLTKGKSVIVSGAIRLAQWENNGEPKSAIELRVSRLVLQGGGAEKPKPKFEADEEAWSDPF